MSLENNGSIPPFGKEQIELIENLAGIGYTVKQLAMILEIDYLLLIAEYENEYSQFRYYFDRGVLMVQAKIDNSNVKLASGGNLTAAVLVQKRNQEIEFLKKKNNILYGEQ